MLMTDNGKLIRIPTRGVSVISRNTQGVKLINMEQTEKVTSAARLAEKEEEVDASDEPDETGEPDGSDAPVEPI
jgi:DNA gyrase subunit A